MTDQIGKTWKKSTSGQYLTNNPILHISADPETVPIPHSVQNFDCQKLSIDENPTDLGEKNHSTTVTLKK